MICSSASRSAGSSSGKPLIGVGLAIDGRPPSGRSHQLSQIGIGDALVANGGLRTVAGTNDYLIGHRQDHRRAATAAWPASTRRAGRSDRSSRRTARRRRTAPSRIPSAAPAAPVQVEHHRALGVPGRVPDRQRQAGQLEQPAVGQRPDVRRLGEGQPGDAEDRRAEPAGPGWPTGRPARTGRPDGCRPGTSRAWQTGSTEKVWSRCPWVSSTATGCSRCSAMISSSWPVTPMPGSIMTHCSPGPGATTKQLVPSELGREALDQHGSSTLLAGPGWSGDQPPSRASRRRLEPVRPLLS